MTDNTTTDTTADAATADVTSDEAGTPLGVAEEAALARWAETTGNAVDSISVRDARETVRGHAQAVVVLDLAGELYEDEPRVLMAQRRTGLHLDEQDYITFTLACYDHGLVTDEMTARKLDERLLAVFDTEQDAARFTLDLVTRHVDEVQADAVIQVPTNRDLTAEEIDEIRQWAANTHPTWALVETGLGFWAVIRTG